METSLPSGSLRSAACPHTRPQHHSNQYGTPDHQEHNPNTYCFRCHQNWSIELNAEIYVLKRSVHALTPDPNTTPTNMEHQITKNTTQTNMEHQNIKNTILNTTSDHQRPTIISRTWEVVLAPMVPKDKTQRAQYKTPFVCLFFPFGKPFEPFCSQTIPLFVFLNWSQVELYFQLDVTNQEGETRSHFFF